MTDRPGPMETRPQAPQGEEKGIVHDVAVGALGSVLGSGGIEGAKVVIGHLRPSVEQPSAPPAPANHEGAGTDVEWNWPRR